MSDLEVMKEQIAYLKYWQGVMVLTDLGLIGWLISNIRVSGLGLIVLAGLGIVALTFGIYMLHRRIERQIESLRDL